MQDFFAYYGMEQAVQIDEQALRQQYLQKSKENHPDFFVNDEDRYQEALEQTSVNNQAYKALSDLDLRIKHILELHGLLADSKDSLPPAFLMEMMELNEALMDARMEEDQEQLSAVQQQIDAFANTLEKELEALPAQLDEASLNTLRTIYLKRRYLRRIHVQGTEM